MNRLLLLVGRGLLLRCPRCSSAPLFQGVLNLHPKCPSCQAVHERERGDWLGSTETTILVGVFLSLAFYLLVEPLDRGNPLLRPFVTALFFLLTFPWIFRRVKGGWVGLLSYWDEKGSPNEKEAPPPLEWEGWRGKRS